MPDGLEIAVTHRLRVRYAETDQMGVVYHANYLVWFHEARDALLREAGFDLPGIEKQGLRFPIVDTACHHLHAARYADELLVQARLLRESVARMRFRFEVRQVRTLRLLATGTTVSVITDAAGRLLLRTPAALDALLDDFAQRQGAGQAKTQEVTS